jgi:hypothetical protein
MALDSVAGEVETASATVIPREAPEVQEARRRLVKSKLELISRAKSHHKTALARIKEDQDFAYKWGVGKQWVGQTETDERYIANVVQRHVTTRVAALYAKNPTVVAKPHRRREFRVWDGSADTLAMAQMEASNAAAVGMIPSPQSLELLQDVQEGLMRKQMIRNIGQTLEIAFHYFMKEQIPDFKEEMKQLVRRTEVCGVGYVKIGYQRLYGQRPDDRARLDDIVAQMQTLERLRADALDDEIEVLDKEYEELRLVQQAISSEPEVVVREGLVWDFPEACRIIVDPRCRKLPGFVGARWIAEEFEMSADDIKAIYRVDVSAGGPDSEAGDTRDLPHAVPRSDRGVQDGKDAPVLVYHMYDRSTGLKYCFCDKWPDFLVEPAPPEVRLERFFPIYALVFNKTEHADELYPPSDVRLLRSQQIEYNRIKEALRQHRIANRPLYAAPRGALDQEDTSNGEASSLANYSDNEVVILNGLKEGGKIGDILQPVGKVPIDPNLYEVEQTFSDIERVSGAQEANMGGTSGSTATESSIAEGSRLSTLESNRDDLDSVLTQMARDGGQVLLLECSAETIAEIVGPGAVWPELSRADIVKEIYLDVQAGSSGRPNRATDIANMERMLPFMIQVGALPPEKLQEHMWLLLDEKKDLTEFLAPGLPSITALNGMMQPSTGDPATDPNAQGGEGGDNAPAAQEGPAGGQAPMVIDYDSQGRRLQ